MKSARIFSALLMSIVLVGMLGMFDVDAAQRGRSGGFRSRPASRPAARPSSRPAAKPAAKPAARSSSTPTRSSSGARPATTAKRSAADQKLYNKAQTSGTAFKSRSSATSAFKTKHASQYKSTYATKPATRPDHIPATTSSGGSTYNVTYNSQHGGYGYMGPSGTWMMYDAMSDAIMLSALMSQNNYYYDPVRVGQGGTAVVRRGPSPLMVVFTIIGIAVILGVICTIVYRTSE